MVYLQPTRNKRFHEGGISPSFSTQRRLYGMPGPWYLISYVALVLRILSRFSLLWCWELSAMGTCDFVVLWHFSFTSRWKIISLVQIDISIFLSRDDNLPREISDLVWRRNIDIKFISFVFSTGLLKKLAPSHFLVRYSFINLGFLRELSRILKKEI